MRAQFLIYQTLPHMSSRRVKLGIACCSAQGLLFEIRWPCQGWQLCGCSGLNNTVNIRKGVMVPEVSHYVM